MTTSKPHCMVMVHVLKNVLAGSMICLGIESSCDETSLALVRDGILVDQVLASQADAHALFGGVVPELASREHYRYIGPLYKSLMSRNGLDPTELDCIAVARGPGLLGCLLVGVSFAKGLALATGARLIGVNHLHAHLLAGGLEQDLPFPALGLLVSGGHTHLYSMHAPLDIRLLGRTLDDAAGEALDKFAKMLHLPYPGGALLDRLASAAQAEERLFPRPYVQNASLDFSFSGLKTAAASYIAKHPELHEAGRAVSRDGEQAATEALKVLCASYVHAVVDTLRIKTERALDAAAPSEMPTALIVAGGVAANSQLRALLAKTAALRGLNLCLPPLRLCTDNGAMIAYVGWLLATAGYCHGLEMPAIARGRAIPDDAYRMS